MDFLMLSHRTAFRYWIGGHARFEPAEIRYNLSNGDNLCAAGAIRQLEKTIPASDPYSRPVDLLVTNRAARSHSERVISHAWLGELPPGSVCRISDSQLIASPAFLYVLLANRASLQELIAFGTALCSSYPLSNVSRSYTANPQNSLDKLLCTKRQIEFLLAKLPNRNGVAKAKRALRWIVEGAASVREAELAIEFNSPIRHGGYGFPPFQLNPAVLLEGTAAKMFGNSKCYPDFLWPKKHLVLEYDSDEYHSSKVQMQKDARKRNALTYMGYEVLTYTNEIFSSATKHNAMTEQLREKLVPREKRDIKPDLRTRRVLAIAAHNIPRGLI